jgi:hypothetical protein
LSPAAAPVLMSAAERAETLRGLLDLSNRCILKLDEKERAVLLDAIALYEAAE